MPTKQTAPRTLKAREAVVITVGARAPKYRTALVRDRHTHRLVEVELTEFEPLDPGSEGHYYAFKRGEEVDADHEAVLTSPGSFVPVEAKR